MLAYLIQQNHDGRPIYFAPGIARQHAASSGWSENPELGVAFARERDATAFRDHFLPHLTLMTTVVAKEVSE